MIARYRVYTTIERGKSNQPLWLMVGTAYQEQVGFLYLHLHALPLSGKVTLCRCYEDEA